MADYSLDHLGDLPLLMLPTQGGKAAGMANRLYRTLSTDVPDELKQKLVSAEFSKKARKGAAASSASVMLVGSSERVRTPATAALLWQRAPTTVTLGPRRCTSGSRRMAPRACCGSVMTRTCPAPRRRTRCWTWQPG